MKSSIFIISILFILSFSSCEDDTVSPDTDSDFYPLAIGNSWIYNLKTFDSTGVLISETQIEEKLPSAEFRDSRLVYEFDTDLWHVHNDKLFLQAISDGLHIFIGSAAGNDIQEDNLLFKYPCKENEIYTNGRNNQDTTIVISLSDTVVCAAGTFNCIVYKDIIMEGDNLVGYAYDYVSYGVGKIKTEIYRKYYNQEFIKNADMSLNSYVINN
jgi:hypothetical protein